MKSSAEVQQQDDPIVEAYEWIETSRLSELVANFARVHILISIFNGDPDRWLKFIMTEGTSEEREHDLPFVVDLRQRLSAEPFLIEDMRRIVRDFSAMFAQAELTS
ncbi:MAG TPA: hypothetical protein VGR02_05735 [Thermoanaerobaculia bacterium]|jgi:hypothetical protein|nr:hypothetical protein [Thermoanaerobaculia bacterium]